ncbi:MAG: hypothetical protein IJF54_02620 [Clostridia bacterium]|nr:hypothetical protein [Clostridia bacterium]
MYFDAKKDLDYALEFTKVYKSYDNKAQRELQCLKMQIPYVLTPISKDDIIVGCMAHGFVGFSPQYGGAYTYYYWDESVVKALDKVRDTVDKEYIQSVEQMRTFWLKENTQQKLMDRFSEKYNCCIGENNPKFYYGVGRIAGMTVDLKRLVKLGLCGLKNYIDEQVKINGDSDFYTALKGSVDLIIDACLFYAKSARELAKSGDVEHYTAIAETFENIAKNKPESFREGLQLVWIYAVCSDLMNYGRMDDYLCDLYNNDLDKGIITEDDAIEMLASFYRNVIRVSKVHDSRIVVAGLGRDNPEKADKLALAIIKTSRKVIDVVPQVTVRYYSGMDPRIMEETLNNIECGAVYPIVYSDDTTVPAMMKAYNINEKMAQKWVPFGCGEYVIEGYGTGTPNTGMTLPIALNTLLHRGVDSFTGEKVDDDYGALEDFKTFDDLFAAYDKMITKAAYQEAYSEHLNYKVAGEEACYLHLSLLINDCIEKNMPIFEGGARYLCATSEIFGLITAADSFTAIKKCVYEDKLWTLPQLVNMLDCDFKGYERERRILLNAPKYGNDDDYADQMAIKVFDHISKVHDMAGKDTMLYRYNVVSVNNSGSAERGAVTAATACGRLKGSPLSNGNSPSIGADVSGITATLNSMAKIDASKHVGVVHNIRFNKDMLKNNKDKIRMLLEIFYKNNGVQTNLSSIGKDDLENALKEPEKYKNLIVRIGGFSARFVELSPIVQNEILLRTTYESV